MRVFLTIVSLFFLVTFQEAVACCDHSEHSHQQTAEAVPLLSVDLPGHIQHHDHDGPCDCVCHQHPHQHQSTTPEPRFELEPVVAVVELDEDRRPDYCVIPSSAPPAAESFTPPPPTAMERCSTHCRFLL